MVDAGESHRTATAALILDAIASLLQAQRPDLAMVLIEQEINY